MLIIETGRQGNDLITEQACLPKEHLSLRVPKTETIPIENVTVPCQNASLWVLYLPRKAGGLHLLVEHRAEEGRHILQHEWRKHRTAEDEQQGLSELRSKVFKKGAGLFTPPMLAVRVCSRNSAHITYLALSRNAQVTQDNVLEEKVGSSQ